MNTDKLNFEKICGDCAGVDISTLTEDDIRHQAKVWAESKELVLPGEVEAAIRYLHQFKRCGNQL